MLAAGRLSPIPYVPLDTPCGSLQTMCLRSHIERRQMPSPTEILAAARVSRDTVNKWEARGFLPEPLPRTVRGIARQFSRKAALGVGFMAALSAGGVPAARAVQIAKEWLKEDEAGTLAPMWAANIFGSQRGLGKDIGFSDRALGFVDFAVALADEIDGGYAGESHRESKHKDAVGILIIDVEAVVMRMDRLFEDEAK